MPDTDWLNRNLEPTQPSNRVTPKDVYAVTIDGKPAALCISCCVGKGVEFVQHRGDDMTLERECQECGLRQGKLI